MSQMVEEYKSRYKKSRQLYEEYSKITPGGVSSSGKYCYPFPLYFARAKGSKMWDVDGNEYIDYLVNYGACILGHAHPKVVEAVKTPIENGIFYGAPNPLEKELAEIILRNARCGEMLRFTNSGTEADMYVLRAARAYTKRDVIGRFEGCFHGNSDFGFVGLFPLLEMAGPDYAPIPVLGRGVPRALEKTIVNLPFNNLEATEALISKHADELAAVIIPTNGAFVGRVPVERDFLKGLREITHKHGILLIFDEVISGFRMALGGAQEYFDVTPDMATYGKIIGGGFPVGAYVGKRDIMELVTPTGDPIKNIKEKVPQLGTFNGHPTIMAAGIATLKELESSPPYSYLDKLGEKLRSGLRNILSERGFDNQVLGDGSASFVHFASHPIRSSRDVVRYSDVKMEHDLSLGALIKGVYSHPWEVGGMLTTAHTQDDVEKTLEIYEEAADALKKR